MEESVKRSIEFPAFLYSQLESISKDFGISIAAVIKIACIEYVRRQGKEADQ